MLTRLFLFLLVGLGGASLAMQMAWNSRLRAATGSAVLTTIISVLVTLLSLVLVWFSGLTPKGSVPAFGSLPRWAWFGGAFAAWYLVTALIAVPKLGTTMVFSLVVAGQMITALILDSTGAFGVPQIPFSPSRALGVALLLGGVLLVQRR
ncbi:MAG: DMT family transporter [Verrucomicrobiaceae bacterium]|nr:MAG: DMT family transporter [Verrucomicrobiaceae bacterium]